MANTWGSSDERTGISLETEHDGNVVTSYYEGGAEVRIGFDPYGAVGGKNFAEIVGPEYYLDRSFYFAEADRDGMHAFAERVVSDAAFRRESLDGTADWCHVSGIYEEAAPRIRVVFESKGLLSFRAGNDRTKRRHREAQERMEELCQAVYEEIDAQVRRDELIVGLDSFVEEKIRRAHEAAEDICYDEPH